MSWGLGQQGGGPSLQPKSLPWSRPCPSSHQGGHLTHIVSFMSLQEEAADAPSAQMRTLRPQA